MFLISLEQAINGDLFHMAKLFSIEKAELGSQWDHFIDRSPDRTIFAKTDYLLNVDCRIGTYFCFNSSELRGAIVLVESKDGSEVIIDDLVIYSGIYLGPPTNKQNQSQQLSERFEVVSFIADWLARTYSKIEFSLPPTVIDIRPFQWFNYGSDKNRYAIDVRYTSFLDISDFSIAKNLDEIGCYVQSSYSRKQQIRYAKKDGVTTEEFTDFKLFIDFYILTMQRQNINIIHDKMDKMKNLIGALIKKEKGKMFISKDRIGNIGSVAVYGLDGREAWYLFGASDPNMRNTPTGTAVLWDAFDRLAKCGITTVDLEGVNSPKRGWFKLSFGGTLKPYYSISNTISV